MVHSALRHGKTALKRALKACGLGRPLRAIQRRAIHVIRMTSPSSFDTQFDRTRVAIAVQAEMTRAAIARETDLIHAAVRMQAASMAALLAEQSEHARSLPFDMIHGYDLESGFAGRSTNHEADDSAGDSSRYLDVLRERLHAPLTASEIIGACKVICAQLPPPERIRVLLEAHRQEPFEPSALLLRIAELIPAARDRLNSSVQRNGESKVHLRCSDNGAERKTA
jgi:hypothetical protein